MRVKCSDSGILPSFPHISGRAGETITPDLVNYDSNYSYGKAPKAKNRLQTTDVGSFPPNAFGLYDMHGNVWEWCLDAWHDNYAGAPTDGMAWIGNDNDCHLVRGGSWCFDPGYCRSAYRNGYAHDARNGNSGFRVVRLLTPGRISSSEADIVSQIDDVFGVSHQVENPEPKVENGHPPSSSEEDDVLQQLNQFFG